MRVIRVAVACAALMVVSTGCPGETNGLPGDQVACVNEQDGYQVRYPAGWHTNPGDVMPPCRVFDANRFELEPATEVPLDLDVHISIEEVSFEQAASGDAEYEEELERHDVGVGDFSGVRIEARSTGAGLVPEDVLTYRYVIDLGGGRTLFATTYDVGDLLFGQKRSMLDRIIATFELLD